MVILMAILLQAVPKDPDFGQTKEFLAKSSDPSLKALLEHELSPEYTETPLQKIGMGDEWVSAARKAPAWTKAFYDRASFWYSKAWPSMKEDLFWGQKMRQQAERLSASKSPAVSRKNIPKNWKTDMGSPTVDGTFSRTGSCSAKIPCSVKTESRLISDPIPVSGKTIEWSAWVRSDGTNSDRDEIGLNYFDKSDRLSGAIWVKAPMDLPFWTYVSGKDQIPKDAGFVRILVDIRSSTGSVWVDDMSVKIDGKELLKNPSFEQ